MGRFRSFRHERGTPVMQAVVFLGTAVLCLALIGVIALLVEVRASGRWLRLAAFTAAGLVLVNAPWLVVCHWMRKRTERELAGMQAGCCRCGYALEGLADGAPCPECGRTPEERVKGRAWLERAVKRW